MLKIKFNFHPPTTNCKKINFDNPQIARKFLLNCFYLYFKFLVTCIIHIKFHLSYKFNYSLPSFSISHLIIENFITRYYVLKIVTYIDDELNVYISNISKLIFQIFQNFQLLKEKKKKEKKNRNNRLSKIA